MRSVKKSRPRGMKSLQNHSGDLGRVSTERTPSPGARPRAHLATARSTGIFPHRTQFKNLETTLFAGPTAAAA